MVRAEVSFVLRLVDDFTGKNISGAVQGFYIKNGMVKPVRKPEGFYVFVDCEKRADLTIETTHYKTRILPSKLLNEVSAPVITVRLYRKVGAVFGDCKWITGESQAEALVATLSHEVSGFTFSGIQQQDGKSVMYLSGYSNENLVGNCYTLGEEGNKSLFYILKQDDAGGYVISGDDIQSQQKGQKLQRVFSDISDINGKFAIPVNDTTKDSTGKTTVLKVEVSEWGCYHEF